MINLLPHETKQDYSYARRNIVIRKWITGVTFAIIGAGLIIAAGLFYMHQTINVYAQQKADAEKQLKVQKLEETQAKLTDVSNNLKLVTQVLGNEVLFSRIMQQIGSVMPNGAVLTNLNIGDTQGGVDIRAATLDQSVGTQVQVNLQDPNNKIFDKVDIINITCGDTLYGGRYPCAVQLRAAFNKCNQFLFVPGNCKTTGTKQ